MADGFTDGYYWIGGNEPSEEPFIAWVVKAPGREGGWGWRLDRWSGPFSRFDAGLRIRDPEAGPILPGAHVPPAGAPEPAPEVVPAMMAPFGPGVCVMGSDGGLWTLFPGDEDFTPLPDLPARRTP